MSGERIGDAGEYYADENNSDCTFPPELDLSNKRELSRWKYLEGGQRLSMFEPKIPHVNETEVQSHVPTDESGLLELAQRLASDTRQLQQEYVYSKQRMDILREERDLLKWHIASNSKVMQLKGGQQHNTLLHNQSLEKKYEETCVDSDRLDREKQYLTAEYGKLERVVLQLEADFAQVGEEMQEWLGRRGDFLAETTHERRLAGKERRLRNRQLQKLYRACNVDKKWHSKIDAVRNADNMILDAYEDANARLDTAFQLAGDVTGPIRANLMEEDPGDPLEGFVSVA